MSIGEEDYEVLRAKKIFLLKRQFENVYDNREILGMEDELKNIGG